MDIERLEKRLNIGKRQEFFYEKPTAYSQFPIIQDYLVIPYMVNSCKINVSTKTAHLIVTIEYNVDVRQLFSLKEANVKISKYLKEITRFLVPKIKVKYKAHLKLVTPEHLIPTRITNLQNSDIIEISRKLECFRKVHTIYFQIPDTSNSGIPLNVVVYIGFVNVLYDEDYGIRVKCCTAIERDMFTNMWLWDECDTRVFEEIVSKVQQLVGEKYTPFNIHDTPSGSSKEDVKTRLGHTLRNLFLKQNFQENIPFSAGEYDDLREEILNNTKYMPIRKGRGKIKL